ncbi:MAG: hypothetical protein GOVbin3661_70 [Prokaryotic dsDNA virus sp.]|nr:MAG: hypothetical protein GOVbin3661_70 [Prokaryotic dsDNA virus sp.]|tara:strand:- start:1440 stop:1709 length:270 start_codon:yes stop_codon:yes gene_type:complete
MATYSEEDCYLLRVWNLNCKYSKLAMKFSNNMVLGAYCEKQLDHLKTFRRALKLLEAYDTRDISGDTTDYNVITYTTIQQILNTLTKKY